MIDYFRNLPAGTYPPDGCALLVRDAWQRFLGLDGLPEHADQFVTADQAGELLGSYEGVLLTPIDTPQHLCMVTARRRKHWHCGVFTAEQPPGYVIHALGNTIKIEPLNQFRRRFDAVEYYSYAAHHRVQPSDQAG